MSQQNKFAAVYREEINSALKRFLSQTHGLQSRVFEAMRYSVENGGKRIRGILTLAFCNACGEDYHKAVTAACALEMVHAYSLVHDDMPCMDDDDMRRGKPSCHIAFDEATALLAGDALLTRAFEIISDDISIPAQDTVQLIRLLSIASGAFGMIGGQMIDLQNEGTAVSEGILQEMYRLKTGALICCAGSMGTILGAGSEEQQKSAARYCEKIGLAFQVIDDILDVTGSESVIGKPIKSDEGNQKTTFVTLFGVEESMKIAEMLTKQAKKEIEMYFSSDSFLFSLANELLIREN